MNRNTADDKNATVREMVTMGFIFGLACLISLGGWQTSSSATANCGFCKCIEDRMFCTSRGLRAIPNLPIDALNTIRVLALQRNFIQVLDVSYLHRFAALRIIDVSDQRTGRCIKLTSPNLPTNLVIKGM